MNNNSDNNLHFLIIASDKYPPFRSDVAILFGNEISKRGHSIDWILQSEEPCESSYTTKWNNGNVYVGRTVSGPSSIKRILKHFYSVTNDFKSIKLIKNNHYDIVQIKDKFLSSLYIIPLTKLYKIKFVYWLSYPFPEASLYAVHTGKARYPLFYWLRGKFLKLLLYNFIMPNSDHIFVQSDQMKKDVLLRGIDEDKLTPVPMGVENSIFSNIVTKKSITTDNSNTVIYIGTLAKVRRLDFLIRVFRHVTEARKNIKLLVVGGSENPDDVEMLKQLSIDLNIDEHISFTGNVSRKAALNYIVQSDICVSPFYPTPILNSTSPTKLIEYMAMGKPVVANDHPEQRKVIQESKGGICVPYEEIAFSNAINLLLDNPEICKKMGIAAQNYVKNHRTYSKIADDVELSYRTIIKK